MSALEEKQQWVKAAFDEWGLNDRERTALIGHEGEMTEEQCDTIYEMKCDLSLMNVSRDGTPLRPHEKPAFEADFLRATSQILGNKTPLEYAADKGTQMLASVLRGPWG